MNSIVFAVAWLPLVSLTLASDRAPDRLVVKFQGDVAVALAQVGLEDYAPSSVGPLFPRGAAVDADNTPIACPPLQQHSARGRFDGQIRGRLRRVEDMQHHGRGPTPRPAARTD